MSDEEVEEVLKHVRELVARNQRLLLENTRLCEQATGELDDAKRWIREFRAEHGELHERIVEMRSRISAWEPEDDRDPYSRLKPSISHDEINGLLGEMQALLEGED